MRLHSTFKIGLLPHLVSLNNDYPLHRKPLTMHEIERVAEESTRGRARVNAVGV